MSKTLEGFHVSLDIEACGEIVLSLGACVFDPATGEAASSLYIVPSIDRQLRYGLRPDAGALIWLLKQSDQARKAITDAQADPASEFDEFRKWWPSPEAWCWAYPTSFDLPVVERAMKAFDKRPPWKWTKTMDGRTLWQLAIARDADMAKIERESNSAEHHALFDAQQQARWYARYLSAVIA